MLAAFAFRYLSVADEVPEPRAGASRRARGAPSMTAPGRSRSPAARLPAPARERRAHTPGDRIAGVPLPQRAGR